jgi:biotin operon repressor
MTMNKFTKYQMAGEVESTTAAKLLYLLLLDTADAKGEITIPQKQVGAALGMSRNTVSRNFHRLREQGLIDVVAQHDIYRGQLPNKYVVREG